MLAVKHSMVPALHVAVGDFSKALELLKKQIALTNYDPLKPLFVDVYTLSKMKIQTLPHTGNINYQLRISKGLPQVAISL